MSGNSEEFVNEMVAGIEGFIEDASHEGEFLGNPIVELVPPLVSNFLMHLVSLMTQARL